MLRFRQAEAQQLVENFDRFKTMKHSISNHAFTERGLYMLATILKSPRATQTTLAIIDTFVEVREMARIMETLQNVTDGGTEQQSLLQKTDQILSTVVGNNLSTVSTWLSQILRQPANMQPKLCLWTHKEMQRESER